MFFLFVMKTGSGAGVFIGVDSQHCVSLAMTCRGLYWPPFCWGGAGGEGLFCFCGRALKRNVSSLRFDVFHRRHCSATTKRGVVSYSRLCLVAAVAEVSAPKGCEDNEGSRFVELGRK